MARPIIFLLVLGLKLPYIIFNLWTLLSIQKRWIINSLRCQCQTRVLRCNASLEYKIQPRPEIQSFTKKIKKLHKIILYLITQVFIKKNFLLASCCIRWWRREIWRRNGIVRRQTVWPDLSFIDISNRQHTTKV